MPAPGRQRKIGNRFCSGVALAASTLLAKTGLKQQCSRSAAPLDLTQLRRAPNDHRPAPQSSLSGACYYFCAEDMTSTSARFLSPNRCLGAPARRCRARVNWMFTTERARTKLARAYPNAANES